MDTPSTDEVTGRRLRKLVKGSAAALLMANVEIARAIVEAMQALHGWRT